MNRIGFTLLSLALILIFSGRAMACWCRHDPEVKLNQAIHQQFRTSSVVFAGEVVEQTVTGLRFRVNSVWKGRVSNEIILTSKNYVLETPDGEHFIWDCAFTFAVGKTYLVYAFVDHGQLEVSKCGRTQFLSDATRDIAELDRLSKRRTNTGSAPFLLRRNPTNRWTGATGSDFRIIIGPAQLLGNAVARSTPPLGVLVCSISLDE